MLTAIDGPGPDPDVGPELGLTDSLGGVDVSCGVKNTRAMLGFGIGLVSLAVLGIGTGVGKETETGPPPVVCEYADAELAENLR